MDYLRRFLKWSYDELLHSKRFWALVAALVAIGSQYFLGEIDVWNALQLLIAALAAYQISLGLRHRSA